MATRKTQSKKAPAEKEAAEKEAAEKEAAEKEAAEKEAAEKEAAEKEGTTLRISLEKGFPYPQYRRGGLIFQPNVARDVLRGDLSDADYAAIEADPRLHIETLVD